MTAAVMSVFAADSRAVSFNADWRFHLGEVAGAQEPGFDDSSWRSLSLPHDWAIEGDFSIDNPSGTGGGALPGGIGWYRKSFEVSTEQLKKHTYIDFDGAYMNATVYINGHRLGTRPYGYASFSYDPTPCSARAATWWPCTSTTPSSPTRAGTAAAASTATCGCARFPTSMCPCGDSR